jgi:hypothetical protein
MKSLKLVLSVIITSLLAVGCSMGELSEENATAAALKFAKRNAEENNLNISQNELKVVQTERVDKMNKWVIYIDYPEARNHDEIKLSPSGWVSVSDNKKVLGYNFTLWGGEHNPGE